MKALALAALMLCTCCVIGIGGSNPDADDTAWNNTDCHLIGGSIHICEKQSGDEEGIYAGMGATSLASSTSADLKTGHVSEDGVTVDYTDSKTKGYGLMCVAFNSSSYGTYFYITIDGDTSARMDIPSGLTVQFIVPELSSGGHSLVIDAENKSWNLTLTIGVSRDVTGVTIDRETLSLVIGTSQKLNATVQPSDALNKDVSWSSSDGDVASVDIDGRVTGVKEGTATITVTTDQGGFTAECEVTVTPSAVPVTGVSVSPGSMDLGLKESHVLTVTISPSDATDKSVTWKSSNSSVASVDSTGKVTGMKEGTATITVKTVDGGFSSKCEVKVMQKKVPVTGISISDGSVDLYVKETYVLSASISPSDATDRNVVWKSSDSSVVKVDQKGKITGVKEGNAIITVTTEDGGFTASCDVNVSVKVVMVVGVTISKSSLDLGLDNDYSLTAKVSPSDATDAGVTWSSSDHSIVSVDGKGKISAKSEGTAIITVKTNDGGFTDACEVKVTKKSVTGVSISPSVLDIGVKSTYRLNVVFSPQDVYDKGVSWSSSDDSIAAVDSSGKVTGIKMGSAKITVTTDDGGYTADCTVNIGKAVVSVKLSKSSLSLISGSSERLTAMIDPTDASNKNVTWSSSDVSVATVDSGGKVSAVSEGTATIIVTTEDGGKTASCLVTVSGLHVEKISLDRQALTLNNGDSRTLTVTISPSGASDKSVRWESSDESVASVDGGGCVTALKVGKATITVTSNDGGMTASCKVTVEAAQSGADNTALYITIGCAIAAIVAIIGMVLYKKHGKHTV